MIHIHNGLDLEISGKPLQQIDKAPRPRSVAVLGPDYLQLKPQLVVTAGDRVEIGSALFRDRSKGDLPVTSPAGGTVSAIHRGARRALLSVVIDIDQDREQATHFEIPETGSDSLGHSAAIRAVLQSSGLWNAFRTRPFSYVPMPDSKPDSLFVNAMDSNPLSANPSVIIDFYKDYFIKGLKILSDFSDAPAYLCHAADSELPPLPAGGNWQLAQFSGPHPSGLSGTHIHFLAPAGKNRTVWTVAYADVIAIGHLFTSGRLMTDRVVALAGPQVKKPRLLQTRLGASVEELCAGELSGDDNRIISGSVLSGRNARGALAWLGRYHNQLSVLAEGRQREFMGWLSAGKNRHSSLLIYLSGLFPGRWPLNFNTSQNGSERAMVPTGNFERVMPLDILPTPLLRYLLAGDSEMAQQLGCLELDEEDLSLCSYVCSGKYEYGPVLRDMLNALAREG